MDLRQLRYFIALAEHRSFVRAADAMGITQPAFSRSIQGLEQELGCQLVDRGSKDLRPTPEGQVVLQHALSLVQGSANLIHEIAQLNKLDTGVYGDMIEMGILDPAKVTRSALQAAASIGGLMITTEAMVAEIVEDKPAMGGMPDMGGMGGMGGMM